MRQVLHIICRIGHVTAIPVSDNMTRNEWTVSHGKTDEGIPSRNNAQFTRKHLSIERA